MSSATRAALAAEDELEIRRLIARVCQALDRSRPDDFARLFTEDGSYRLVSPEFDGRREQYAHHGRESLLEFARGAAAKRQGFARHWTSNVIVQPDGRGGATAWSYTMLVEIDPDTKTRRILLTGTHEDVLARTPDGWRIASRTVVADV